MNCFNIRELQGNLKRRFFADLINISDHREFLDSTMIGLRFRTNNEFNVYHDTFTFHNMGITTEQKSRAMSLENMYGCSNLTTMSYFNSLPSMSTVIDSFSG